MRYRARTKPFPHQARGSIFAARHKNAALFMEPRLGKTKAALDAMGMLALAPRVNVRKVLVLSPLIAQDVWDAQIRAHFPFTAECETHDEEWIIPRDPPAVSFYFLNYEKVARRVRGKRGYTHPYLDEVERWGPDVIVCDESHRLKRAGGVTAQATWRMVRRLRKARGQVGGPPYVILLTGTPNPKGWIDLFAQFRIMDERILGTAKADFEEEYVVYGRGPMKYSIVKYQNLDSLKKRISPKIFSQTAEQAGLAGKQFWQDLWVKLPPKARLAYEEMAEEFLTEIEGVSLGAANPAVKRLRLLQITGGFTTDGREVHREKVRRLELYAGDLLLQEQHVVVYCRYLAELDAVAEALDKVGYPVADIRGGSKRSDFRREVATFQSSKTPRALAFQVATGSLAIELTAAAEVVFYSPPDGWEQYYQATQRVMGPNQKRPVRYTHILARHTMDGPVMSSLANKEDYHATLMKNPRRFLYGYLDEG